MLKTRITDLFGIEHPVIQGGMQWVGYAEQSLQYQMPVH